MRRQARAGELRLFSVEKAIGRVPSRRSLVCLPRLLTPPSPFVRAAPCRARARASSPPRAGVTDRVRSREYASNPFEEKLVRSGCSAAATRARPPAARIAAVAAPAASALAALPCRAAVSACLWAGQGDGNFGGFIFGGSSAPRGGVSSPFSPHSRLITPRHSGALATPDSHYNRSHTHTRFAHARTHAAWRLGAQRASPLFLALRTPLPHLRAVDRPALRSIPSPLRRTHLASRSANRRSETSSNPTA